MPPPRIPHARGDFGAAGRPARTITAPARHVSVCRNECPNRPAAPEAIHPAARDARSMTTVDQGNAELHGGALLGIGGGALESAVLLTVKDLALSIFQICGNLDTDKTLYFPRCGCNIFLGLDSSSVTPSIDSAKERGDQIRSPLFDYRLIIIPHHASATYCVFVTSQGCRTFRLCDRTDALTPHCRPGGAVD